MLVKIMFRLAEISVGAGVAAVALTLLSPWLNRRFVARWKYWVWLLLALRLVLPLNLSLPRAPVRVDIPQTELALPAYILQVGEPAPMEPPAPSAQPVTQGMQPGGVGIQPTTAVPAGKTGKTVTLPQAMAVCWLAGAVLFALWYGAGHLYYRRRLLRWSRPVAEKELLDLYGRQCGLLGVKGAPRLYFGPKGQGPLVMGLGRGRLILPAGSYRADELALIFRHELVHYRRRDLWYKLLLLAANCLHWFNPAIYLMVRQAGRDLELSCDAEVIRGLSPRERRLYSETILAAAEKGPQNPRAALTTGFGGGVEALKERLRNIMGTGLKKRGAAACVAVALLVSLGGSFVACNSWQGPALPPPPQVDLSDTSQVTAAYLYYPAAAAITSDSWESPEEIPADRLVRYYALKEILAGNPEADLDGLRVPAGQLEQEVGRYFGVSADYLRTASLYLAEENAYYVEGLGAPVAINVTGVRQSEGQLEIEYEYYSQADSGTVARQGVLAMEADDSGFRYLACRTTAPPSVPTAHDLERVVELVWGAPVEQVLLQPIQMGQLDNRGIQVTRSFLDRFANLLAAYEAVEAGEEVYDGVWNGRLAMQLQAGQKVSGHAYLELSAITGPDGGPYTLLSFPASGELPGYRLDALLFEEVRALLEEHAYQYPHSFDGNGVLVKEAAFLIPGQPYLTLNSVVEAAGALLLDWTADGEAGPSFLDVIDPATGQSLSQARMEAAATHVDPWGEEGWDYRVFFPDQILYRSVGDPEKDSVVLLPQEILGQMAAGGYRPFDLNRRRNLLVWAGEEGIYRSAPDGTGTQLLLDNTALPGLFQGVSLPGQASAERLRYSTPMLLDGGRRVAASVYLAGDGNDDGYWVGMTVADAVTGEAVHRVGEHTPISGPAEKLGDSLAGLLVADGYRVMDVATGEEWVAPIQAYRDFSSDYRRVYQVVSGRNADGMIQHTLASYNPSDRSEAVALLNTMAQHLTIARVTEHYALCHFGGEKAELLIVPLEY